MLLTITQSALLLASLAAVQAGSFNTKNVKALSAKTFAFNVLENEFCAMVWSLSKVWQRSTADASKDLLSVCVVRLEPEYERAAVNMKGLVNFSALDCDQDDNKPLCGQYGVQGFPTIKIFPGNRKKSPRDYNGQRTAKALADGAADVMPSHVKKLKTASDVETLLSSERSEPVAILFTSAALVTPLYKGLSTEFKDVMSLYAIKDSPELADIKANLTISKVPTLVVLKAGSTEPQSFKGAKFSYDALANFLRGFVKKSNTSKSEL